MSVPIAKLQELPWHQGAWAQLARQIERDRLPNGLLLVGPAGVGKQQLAERVVASLLCQDLGTGAAACGSCRGCTLRKAGHHPDLVLAQAEEGKATLGVDVVREFNRKIFLTSSHGQGRLGFMPAADSMNIAAANALLKTLEEPPSGATLILVASSLANLPATIRSRCQLVPVSIGEPDTARAWLQQTQPNLSAAAQDWYAARPMLASRAEDEQDARQRWKTGLQAVWSGHADPLACAAAVEETDAEAWTSYGHHLLRELMRGQVDAAWNPVIGSLNTSGRAAVKRLADSVQAALHLQRTQASKRLMLEMQCMEWARAGRAVRQQGTA